jgi:hypothetical protein
VVLALQERTVLEKIQVGSDQRRRMSRVQVMGHPWAAPTAIEIWLGDVPKGEVGRPRHAV